MKVNAENYNLLVSKKNYMCYYGEFIIQKIKFNQRLALDNQVFDLCKKTNRKTHAFAE